MSLVLGAKMLRLDDGVQGTVIDVGTDRGEYRIAYLAHGEQLIAEKKEKWVPADPPPVALRLEEIDEVARAADFTLRAIDHHQRQG